MNKIFALILSGFLVFIFQGPIFLPLIKSSSHLSLSNDDEGIPMGGIIMWSGPIDNIPDGWALCDGTNGTPNLVDRFILASEGNIGEIGAADADMTVKIGISPHYVQRIATSTTGTTVSASAVWHTHPVIVQVNDLRPAYYRLAFIMKIQPVEECDGGC